MSYVYIGFTVVFTVYGQLILKWAIGRKGGLPVAEGERWIALLGLLLDPWILSGFAAAFMASLAWMAAVSRLELSHAYPFMSLNFVVVVLLSGWLFAEPVTPLKLAGLALIVTGIVIGSQG